MGKIAMRVAMLALLLASQLVFAGQNCSERSSGPEAVRKALELALKTREKLEQSQAKLVLIGRVGSDLSKHGLRYSHAGFAWRDSPKGRWIVTHLLNHCGSATSALFEEGLGNFFMDDPFVYEAIVAVPSPALQERLVAVLDSPLPLALYTPAYSMIAHPFSTRYQNSNQWLLELSAAGLANRQIFNRADAHRWLRESDYAASSVAISAMERIGAGLFSANVRFDDHEFHERSSGRYKIVSVESVINYISGRDTGARAFVVALK
jgi:hypothetical protein